MSGNMGSPPYAPSSSGLRPGALSSVQSYDTALDPNEEQRFQGWVQQLGQQQGRDASLDLEDYDLRGFWKSQGALAGNGHMTDQFKKPNHPTFSDQSQYHGVSGNQGGQWQDLPGGRFSFTPGTTNTQNWPADKLRAYFSRVEPGNDLILP